MYSDKGSVTDAENIPLCPINISRGKKPEYHEKPSIFNAVFELRVSPSRESIPHDFKALLFERRRAYIQEIYMTFSVDV